MNEDEETEEKGEKRGVGELLVVATSKAANECAL